MKKFFKFGRVRKEFVAEKFEDLSTRNGRILPQGESSVRQRKKEKGREFKL